MGNISGPRNRDYGSVSGPRNRDYGSTKFLGPETDIMGQFLGPETDIMGERYFMKSLLLNEWGIECSAPFKHVFRYACS